MKRVVLVRPLGPRNVGSVLRAVANFGPAEVALVAPPKPSILIHPDFVQMSHGVENVRERVQVFATLSEALEECTASVGFTARARGHVDLQDWRAARTEICARAHDPEELQALVFGSEEGGLTTEETAPLQQLVRIPTSDEHTSINVAMTVVLVLATIFFESAGDASANARTPLEGRDRDFLVARAKDVLSAQAASAPARRDITAAVERVLRRAPLETRDARGWHLLLRALGNEKSPRDYGL